MTEERFHKRYRWRSGSEALARFSLFAAALAPMAIWPLSGASLARPFAAFVWAAVCACLAAFPPGRGMRVSAWLQTIALPCTLGWVGAVAVTGAGPSNAMMDSTVAGAFHEALTGASLAIAEPRFIAVAVLTLCCCVGAIWATRGARKQSGNAAGLVFIGALLPVSSVALDAGGFQSFARIAGPEARISVPWLSNLGLAKEAASALINRTAFGEGGVETNIRSSSSAVRLFDAKDGLAVFVVGESLRADAFVNESRGPWSKALLARIKDGLAVRLPDACAGSNATFGSVPRLLTAVDVTDTQGAAHSPTILAMAKAGGAKTAYINNQEIWVLPELGHDLLQKTSSMEVHAYDEVVIEALGDFIKRTGTGPKAALLHLYGQHFYYEDRYPPDLFGSEPSRLSGDSLAEMRYGRAAEYGVRVLMLAAKVLDEQSEPAFLVFTSDHGENLPSDGTGKRYHAGPSSGTSDTMVPALVMWNKAFLDSGRTKVLARLTHAHGAIAHRDVSKAWLALAGLPGDLASTPNPMTWGSVEPGGAASAVACSVLKP